MDTQPVLIGSNTKNGRRKPQPKPERPVFVKPEGMVDCFIEGEFIEEVPLARLIRFSKTAADAFSRSTWTVTKASSKPTESTTAERKDSAVPSETGVAQLTSDMENMSKPSDISTTTPPENKRLDLDWEALWTQPDIDVLRFIFQVMEETEISTAKGHQIDMSKSIADMYRYHNQSLGVYIEFYAAAQCLQLRPWTAVCRRDVLAAIERGSIKPGHIQSMHEQIAPYENMKFMTLLINRWLAVPFEEPKENHYDDREEDEAYLCNTTDELYYLFTRLRNQFEKRRQYVLQSGTEASQKSATVEASSAVVDGKQAAGTAGTTGAGRRRRRR